MYDCVLVLVLEHWQRALGPDSWMHLCYYLEPEPIPH